MYIEIMRSKLSHVDKGYDQPNLPNTVAAMWYKNGLDGKNMPRMACNNWSSST